MRRFLTTVPKSGTHLMRNILRMSRADESAFRFISRGPKYNINASWKRYPVGISGHIPYAESTLRLSEGMQRFHLLRDPRDTIVAWSHYKEIHPEHIFRQFLGVIAKNISGSDDAISALIVNLPPMIESFLGWLDDGETIIVRYEDILDNPREALKETAEALNEDLDELVELSKWRAGPTFRKGVAGEWKKEFQPHHLEAFNTERWRNIMDRWEYR